MTTAIWKEVIEVRGHIELLSGLHIGGADNGSGLLGLDNVIVRNPLNFQPYLPGSSLKGKLRSVLERVHHDKIRPARRSVAGECACGACMVCTLFGRSVRGGGVSQAGPTRLVVRDANLANADAIAALPGIETPFAEVKTEAAIDRITARSTPRYVERVPAGAKFSFQITLRVYEGDERERMLAWLYEGLRLIESDYLGAGGTRGYGQVAIKIDTPSVRVLPSGESSDEESLGETAVRAARKSMSADNWADESHAEEEDDDDSSADAESSASTDDDAHEDNTETEAEPETESPAEAEPEDGEESKEG